MRIAIIGSAPSSAGLAPYEDPSWTIWGCSPGAIPHARRIDAWFELHYYIPEEPTRSGMVETYLKWLRELGKPIYMLEQYADIPTAVKYPKQDVYNAFGPYFYTSSVAWMLALAILQQPEEIGLWGIDMAARDEYEYQRAGCHHFLQIARHRGIKITAPLQSDILRPEPEYGLQMPSPITTKMVTRQRELQARLSHAQGQHDALSKEILFLQGALDDVDYWIHIWSDQDPRCIVV